MKIIFLMLIVTLCFGQNKRFSVKPFNAADTIGSITVSDSVYIQMGKGGQWKLLTSSLNDTAMITGDDKVLEQIVTFTLASESYWTYLEDMRFRILSTGVDTITSGWTSTGLYNGAFILRVKPDTVGTNTFYYDTEFQGN